MQAPTCRVCGMRHWGGDHIWPRSAMPRHEQAEKSLEAEVDVAEDAILADLSVADRTEAPPAPSNSPPPKVNGTPVIGPKRKKVRQDTLSEALALRLARDLPTPPAVGPWIEHPPTQHPNVIEKIAAHAESLGLTADPGTPEPTDRKTYLRAYMKRYRAEQKVARADGVARRDEKRVKQREAKP